MLRLTCRPHSQRRLVGAVSGVRVPPGRVVCSLDGVLGVIAAALQLGVQLVNLGAPLHRRRQRAPHVLLHAVQRQRRLVHHDVHVLGDALRRWRWQWIYGC